MDKDYRRKGVGLDIISKIADFANQHNKTMLITNFVMEEDGKFFLKKIKQVFSSKGYENKLFFDQVNWNLVNQWITEGKKFNPQTKLIIVNEIPEQYLTSFSELYNLGQN